MSETITEISQTTDGRMTRADYEKKSVIITKEVFPINKDQHFKEKPNENQKKEKKNESENEKNIHPSLGHNFDNRF